MQTDAKVTVSSVTLSDEINRQGTSILKYTITYPEFLFHTNKCVINRINAHCRGQAQVFRNHTLTVLAKSAEEDYLNSIENGYPIHEYEAVQSFVIALNQSCRISLYTDRYEYTGGAHGNTIRSSDTWNLYNGKRLSLKALFPCHTNCKDIIKNEIARQIAEQISSGAGSYFENYVELVEKSFYPDNFYLTPDALAVYFQQYDIAPYSSGIPIFLIPYESLGICLPR